MIEPRIFHGNLTPESVAQVLVSAFNRGNLRAQQLRSGDQVLVQIASRDRRESGGQTALSVRLNTIEDGVSIQLGKQAWLGVAASLGETAFRVWRNPLELLNRLDDLAQDIENLQLVEEVWRVIEETARLAGASAELSERFRRMECSYCHTANPVGEPSCIACGAPLGDVQPRTCRNCGFLLKPGEFTCPNCGRRTVP